MKIKRPQAHGKDDDDKKVSKVQVAKDDKKNKRKRQLSLISERLSEDQYSSDGSYDGKNL